MTFRILYIHSYSLWYSRSGIMSIFYRISNYLHSKQNKLDEKFEEEYLDLDYEDLPKFTKENLEGYRSELRDLLQDLYGRFPFDVVFISCYDSYSYINCIEVASIIKTDINLKSLIAVGGIHPTMLPDDFQPMNFPSYFYKTYPKEFTPFDYIIKEEGERPVYKLVQSIMSGSHQIRRTSQEHCIILPTDLINNLDDLPIINLKIFEKYKDILDNLEISKIWIDFSRGCPFKCFFCLNSTESFPCYKNVRIKSVEKCIAELKAIKAIDLFPIKAVHFTDLIFFSKRSLKNAFFHAMDELVSKEGPFSFNFFLMDRVEFCSLEDLERYKKFNMSVSLGTESFSKSLLNTIGKVKGTQNQSESSESQYLRKVHSLIKKASQLNLQLILNYLFCVPGTNEKIIKEEIDFFFKKGENDISLAESYKFRLGINPYRAYFGTKIYENTEKFGARVYNKEWWKTFDPNQHLLAAMIDPQPDFKVLDAQRLSRNLIKRVLKKQSEIGNEYYSKLKTIGILVNSNNEYKGIKKILNH